MATALHTTIAPALNSARVLVPDWTSDPRVRPILASFRDSAPPLVDLPRHECWGTQTTGYTGFRVACLRILRADILNAALHAAWDRNDGFALDVIADAMSVDDAVTAAIRIPALRLVTAAARQLNPAKWGAAA